MAVKKKKKASATKKKSVSAPMSSKPEQRYATVINAQEAFGKSFPTNPFAQFQPFKLEATMMKGNKQFDKFTQDANSFGQGQMDAVNRSAAIFAKGMEDLIQTCMEISQDAGQKSQAAAKSVMACKTLNEFTDVQTRLAQSSYDDFMTNLTRLSEKSVKLCTDVFEPMNDQMGRTMKKASDLAA